MGGFVGQDRGARGALGPGRDAHGAVLHLFEEIGFAAGSAEPEMFHTTCSALVRSGRSASDVEDVDAALAEIVEWFAALWICAVIHHGGPRRNHGGYRVPHLHYWESIALHVPGERRAGQISSRRYTDRMLPKHLVVSRNLREPFSKCYLDDCKRNAF